MNLRVNPTIWVVLLSLGLVWPVAAADIYVDVNAPGVNNGTSWTHAFRYLQDALDLAQPGDTVKVGQGTYRPHLRTFAPLGGRDSAFVLITGVTIRGGYKGNSPRPPINPDLRDPNLFLSVLSGDLDGNDVPVNDADVDSLAGLIKHPSRQDNAYTVVVASHTEPNAVLDGFVIEGGNANNPDPNVAKESLDRRGGGLGALRGQATIRNCRFQHNSGAEGGGAVYGEDGTLEIENCTFVGNYADTSGGYGGGAILVSSGKPKILHGRFLHNAVGFQASGGAIKNLFGAPEIRNCRFESNEGGQLGGAISSQGNAIIADCVLLGNTADSGGAFSFSSSDRNQNRPQVQYCSVIGNTSTSTGGATYLFEAEPTFLGCSFVANEAGSSGGGAFYVSNAEPNLINCVFNGNVAIEPTRGAGGAMQLNAAMVSVFHCTFAHNQAARGDSVACVASSPIFASHLDVRNSILWNGTADEIFIADGSTHTVGFTNMKQWDSTGPGNSTNDPQFADPDGPDNIPGTEDDNLRLQGGDVSPCVDSGNNFWIPAGVILDADRNVRQADDPTTPDTGWGDAPIVDRGAYEFNSAASLRPVADAGDDQTVHAGGGNTANVKLDGTGSYDPAGRPLSYRWTWPGGLAHGATPTVILPVGTTVVTLVVNNGIEDSLPDAVAITVLAQGGLKPVAVAGDDRTVLTQTSEADVTLDGSASYDPSGHGIIFYQWNWTVGSQQFNRYEVQPTITLPLGTHAIRLRVHNGVQYSDWDTVAITVAQQPQNQKPVADAGKDQTLFADSSNQAQVSLDGSGSSDPSGHGIIFYHWTWTVGSQTENRYSVAPTITLPVGVHVIRLRVHNGVQYSDWDEVRITVLQSPVTKPVADAGKDQSIFANAGNIATNVQLDGSGSHDPGGRPLTYSWTWTTNSQNWSASGMRPVIPWLPLGTTVVTLHVSNGLQTSDADTVAITVQPQQHSFDMWLMPGHVTPNDDDPYVLMLMDVRGVAAGDIDMATPLSMEPGNLTPIGQHLTVRNSGTVTATIFAFWDETAVLAANPTGIVTLTVRGRLKNGTPFTGQASVQISH